MEQGQSEKRVLMLKKLLNWAHISFRNIPEISTRQAEISLADCLMSGLALFEMKYPSLLQFDREVHSERIKHNIKNLYHVSNPPSDTFFRYRLDELEPKQLQKTMNFINKKLLLKKQFNKFLFLGEYLLVALDASGYFSSNKIHCDSCCEKHHRNGKTEYYHQMLAAVAVNPDYKVVFPLILEPIGKKDGTSKNDCEHSASERLLRSLKRTYPEHKIIVTMDALYADGTILHLLKELGFSFIITAKETRLAYLFEIYKAVTKSEVRVENEKFSSNIQFSSGLPLNYENSDFQVNVLTLSEKNKIKPNEKEKTFGWITNLKITTENAFIISKGGRARWHIENETFNTLKNQGYEFEHNFGHGKKHLNVVMAYLMFLSFLIDQIQEFLCGRFQEALIFWKIRKYFWNHFRGFFLYYFVDDWEDIFSAVLGGLIKNKTLRDALLRPG